MKAAKSLTVFTLLLAWITALPGNSYAASYDVTKSVTWNVTTVGGSGVPNTETIGANTGHWRYAQHVLAWHDNPNVAHHDNPLLPKPILVNTAPLILLDTVNATPSAPHLHWSDLTGFDQNFNLAKQNFPLVASVPPNLPVSSKSDSLVELSTNKLAPINNPNVTFRTEALIHLKGSADILLQNVPDRAESFSAGEINLTGVIMAASGSKVEGKKVGIINAGLVSTFNATANGAVASYRDPLTLTISDAVTGKLIAEKQLYSETWNATGEASVESGLGKGLVQWTPPSRQ